MSKDDPTSTWFGHRAFVGTFYEEDEPVEVIEERFRNSTIRGTSGEPLEWKPLYVGGHWVGLVCSICSSVVQDKDVHSEFHRFNR